MKIFIMLLLLNGSFFWNYSEAQACEKLKQKSVKTLINSLIVPPDIYNGQLITIEGYVRFEFERDEICSHIKDDENQCIWIEIDSGPFESKNDLLRFTERENFFKKFDKKT